MGFAQAFPQRIGRVTIPLKLSWSSEKHICKPHLSTLADLRPLEGRTLLGVFSDEANRSASRSPLIWSCLCPEVVQSKNKIYQGTTGRHQQPVHNNDARKVAIDVPRIDRLCDQFTRALSKLRGKRSVSPLPLLLTKGQRSKRLLSFFPTAFHYPDQFLVDNPVFEPFHSQEWSMPNFSCRLTRNISSHGMENLAFHSLLRWKMIILLQILTTLRG